MGSMVMTTLRALRRPRRHYRPSDTPSIVTPAMSKPVTSWPALARLAAIGRAHVAQSDKSDFHDVSFVFSKVKLSGPRGISIFVAASAGRASRLCCQFGLRSLSMIGGADAFEEIAVLHRAEGKAILQLQRATDMCSRAAEAVDHFDSAGHRQGRVARRGS